MTTQEMATATPTRQLGTAKQLAMRAGWAMTSLRDWREYRKRKARFTADTQGGTIHRIEHPLGHRTRHTYRIVEGRAFTTFQMDQRWKIVAAR